MTKIEIFEAAFGTMGWNSLMPNVNKFMERKHIISVLQSTMGDRLIITVVYRE